MHVSFFGKIIASDLRPTDPVRCDLENLAAAAAVRQMREALTLQTAEQPRSASTER